MKLKFFQTVVLMLLLGFVSLLQGQELTPEQKLKQKGNLKADNSVFIKNKGQWDAQALYLAKTNGLNAWVTKDGIVFDHHRYIEDKNAIDDIKKINPFDTSRKQKKMMKESQAFKMKFVGGVLKMSCPTKYSQVITIIF